MAKRTITKITCPNCNYVISLDEAIIKPLEEKIINQIKREAKKEVSESYEKEKQNLAEKIKNATLEEHRLKDKKKDKIISDLQKQLEKLQKKAEQSSQKLTGDVLELDIIDILRETFHFDQIDKIKSGTRGADILQKVCTKMEKSCGTIIIESKNAQKWSDSWISKLRKDQRDSKAEIAVLCSTVLPEDVKNLTLKDEIIVVHRKNLIPVIMMLRNQLFEVDRTKNYNVDMNEKKQALYNYLTSVEFRQKVEAVVEAFKNMHSELQTEKNAMTRIWSKREKQIQQALLGLASMYGGMQGILGPSIPEINSLTTNELLEENID